MDMRLQTATVLMAARASSTHCPQQEHVKQLWDLKLRKDFMSDTISRGSMDLIQNIKKSEDPNNIFGINNNIVNKK